MELLSFLLEREAIIGLGIFGAFAVVAGNFLLRPKSSFPKQYARYVIIFGYSLTWISITFFIIAGFATAYAGSL